MFTVTTAATNTTLLTAAEARAAIGGVTATDTQITDLIARVSATIVRACRVPASGATPPTLRLETITETFRLKSRQESLVLSRRPGVAVSSVVEDGVTLDADEYEIDAAAGILYRLSDDDRTCWPGCKIVVVYSAGWETVPDDLKLAAVKLAGVLWSEGERVDPNLKSISIPGVVDREYWVAPSSDTLIPQEVLDLLGPYMNHVVG